MNIKSLKPALLLAIGLGCTLPALADPPPWAPAHGRRAHEDVREQRYVYYRNEVPMYYAPQRGLWFWLSGNSWQFGARLPAQYQQYASGGISIQLDTDRPYEQNRYVEQHYGRPRHAAHADRRPPAPRDAGPRRDERGPGPGHH